jgi:predicted HicB family RNase H-like nuclease
MQSIRIAVGDNRKMKLLATRLGVSFNSWAVETLLAEVARQALVAEKIEREMGGG